MPIAVRRRLDIHEMNTVWEDIIRIVIHGENALALREAESVLLSNTLIPTPNGGRVSNVSWLRLRLSRNQMAGYPPHLKSHRYL